jgi:hypothetical protein
MSEPHTPPTLPQLQGPYCQLLSSPFVLSQQTLGYPGQIFGLESRLYRREGRALQLLALQPESEMFPHLTDCRKLQLLPHQQHGTDVERQES